MPNADFTITRDQLVRRSLRRLGNTSPSATEISEATTSLNLLVKRFDAKGRWEWCISNTESSLTLVSSQRSYATGSTATTIATDIYELENVQILNGTTYGLPLQILSKSESLSTPLKEGTGEPIAVFHERATNLANSKLHFFQTPNSAFSVKYHYRRRIYDLDSASDNPDVPQEAIDALGKALTLELALEYDVPLDKYQVYRAEALEAESLMRASNDHDATPEYQATLYF